MQRCAVPPGSMNTSPKRKRGKANPSLALRAGMNTAAGLTLLILLSGIFLISPTQAGGGKKKNPFAPEPERGNQYLSGIVVDPQGKPVAGATIIAFLPDGTPISPRAKDFDFYKRKSPREQTDEKGRFSLHDLPDKPIKLMIYPGKPWNRTAYPAHVRTTLNQSDIRVLLDPTLEQEIEDLDVPKKAKNVMAVPANWPAFRGAGHQGQAGPGDYPIRWGPAENLAWKVTLPGPGASSPVVQGERVFVTCFTGKKGPEIVRYLICFDRKTGKQLWEIQRPAPQPESDYAGQVLQHGMATATPIVEGDRIYVNFCRGGVFAFDLGGKELWQRELGIFRNGFGSAASPSICDNLVLVNATVEAGAFFALDKSSGEIVWRTKLTGDGWATPVVVETAQGAKEIVLNAPAGLFGYDPRTGKELWRCDTVGGYTSSTPVSHKDVLYLIGSNFARKAAAAIRAGGRGDVSKTHVLWTNSKVGASYCSPLVIGEHLYFFSGQATCLNRNTGEVAAQNRLDGVTQLYSSPIAAGGKIYLFTRDQGAYVLAADPKMTVLAHNVLGDPTTINASPAGCGGDLFIRSQTYLYCLRKK